MSILSPTPEAIRAAAKVIRDGGVIVMPTETVYGLACNALNAEAVRRVFEIKDRPVENPLIVHIAGIEQLGQVAASWPPIAEKLASLYWPGPLTMVLPKTEAVPLETTGGLPNVAVRVPSHPVALEILRQAECPIAAPSANVFMSLSPTSAEDVDPVIQLEVEHILDGGPCEVGLESTVVDLTEETPVILRPGGVTRAEIQALVGQPLGHLPPTMLKKSPGLYRRHYAPKAIVQLVPRLDRDDAGLTFEEPQNDHQVRMPRDARAYAANLYAALRKLDLRGIEKIAIEIVPDSPEWEAINDRLKKASAPPGS